jgi:hypothetical protein
MFAAIDEQLALVIAASAGLITALGAIIVQLVNLKVHVMENGINAKAGAEATATSNGRTLGMVVEDLEARAVKMQIVVDKNNDGLKENVKQHETLSGKIDNLNELVTAHIESDEKQFEAINVKLDKL